MFLWVRTFIEKITLWYNLFFPTYTSRSWDYRILWSYVRHTTMTIVFYTCDIRLHMRVSAQNGTSCIGAMPLRVDGKPELGLHRVRPASERRPVL